MSVKRHSLEVFKQF